MPDVEEPGEMDRGGKQNQVTGGSIDGFLQFPDLLFPVPHGRQHRSDLGIFPKSIGDGPYRIGAGIHHFRRPVSGGGEQARA